MISGLHLAPVCTVVGHGEWLGDELSLEKLSMKIFFKSSHEWIESCLKLSSHVRGADSRAIGKYMTLVEFVPPATLIAVEYIRSHCLGSCLPSYFFRFCMFTGLKPVGYSAYLCSG